MEWDAENGVLNSFSVGQESLSSKNCAHKDVRTVLFVSPTFEIQLRSVKQSGAHAPPCKVASAQPPLANESTSNVFLTVTLRTVLQVLVYGWQWTGMFPSPKGFWIEASPISRRKQMTHSFEPQEQHSSLRRRPQTNTTKTNHTWKNSRITSTALNMRKNTQEHVGWRDVTDKMTTTVHSARSAASWKQTNWKKEKENGSCRLKHMENKERLVSYIEFNCTNNFQKTLFSAVSIWNDARCSRSNKARRCLTEERWREKRQNVRFFEYWSLHSSLFFSFFISSASNYRRHFIFG